MNSNQINQSVTFVHDVAPFALLHPFHPFRHRIRPSGPFIDSTSTSNTAYIAPASFLHFHLRRLRPFPCRILIPIPIPPSACCIVQVHINVLNYTSFIAAVAAIIATILPTTAIVQTAPSH